ncbi:MAG: GNAT family N-acetyltransferase [Thermoclostridium sp.]|nr:GNAT family N-acetyltransferase [Thermoclostridium sp.]
MIISQNKINLRKTEEIDLPFVLEQENSEGNRNYIRQWPLEMHKKALSDENILHMIVEDEQGHPVGYAILADLHNPSNDIMLQRIVIVVKGKGYGRDVLKALKKLAFHTYHAHRLHLLVRTNNDVARKLYLSEGFVEEGTMREFLLIDGVYHSSVLMSILADEYEKINAEKLL